MESAGHPTARSVFAANFRAWRRRSGKPLKTVAQDLDVSMTTVNNWERGIYFFVAEKLDALSRHAPLLFSILQPNAVSGI